MKNKDYSLVIFDWEGTIADTLGLALDCVIVEAKRLNLGSVDLDLARQVVEFGLAKAIGRLFPGITALNREALLHRVQQALALRHGETFLIEGAKEIILRLRQTGVSLAIATNRGPQSLQRALHSSGLAPFFQEARAAGILPPKPDPEMLLELLAVFNLRAEQALMIGDSITDIQMAKSIEMDAFGVNFYQQSSEKLLEAGAMVVFDSYELMAEYLKLPALMT